MDRYFEHRHTVGFEETNLVGNVYYVNYLRWQGRCRELFLKAHCPELLTELRHDLRLFTLRVDCEYIAELTAFDEVAVRMRLIELTSTQLEFGFEYLKLPSGGSEMLAAQGRQRVACLREVGGNVAPTRVPESLTRALVPYLPVGGGSAAEGR